jgi:hypothetical protein
MTAPSPDPRPTPEPMPQPYPRTPEEMPIRIIDLPPNQPTPGVPLEDPLPS